MAVVYVDLVSAVHGCMQVSAKVSNETAVVHLLYASSSAVDQPPKLTVPPLSQHCYVVVCALSCAGCA